MRLPGLPRGTELLAYADTLALTVQTKTEVELKLYANKALDNKDWMTHAGFSMAPQKSDTILLIGRKKLTGRSIEYLAVHLDLKATDHIKL